MRVHILLVADDQIFPESCIMRLQASVSIAEQWAHATHQEYHVGTPEKTAVLLIGAGSARQAYTVAPIMLGGAPVSGTLLKNGSAYCGMRL